MTALISARRAAATAGVAPVRRVIATAALVAISLAAGAEGRTPAPPPAARTMADVLAAAGPSDWRPLDAGHTLYLELDSGRVVIELAPRFAPEHAANILRLARQGYYDGLAIVRSQDNFVVQWGDPDGKRPLGEARATLPPEFTAPLVASLSFTPLPDADGYAPEAERSRLEVLRTDTATFAALVEVRRNRHDDWYKRPAGYVDLCNVPVPVRGP